MQVPPSEDPCDDHAEPTFPSNVQNKEGFAKLQGACDYASRAGLEYIWIDTCCIDKTSSAELSEAINSMYAWYQDSAVCYVYLHDVGGDEDPRAGFEDADWFRRGWTLQELIAPDNVYFFNKYWIKIGSKATFVDILEKITRIRQDILLGIPCKPSIAEKMSWAAGRKTQKIEDRAYSLMGLFGIHMPIIYGEGEKAFRRLQLKIMKSSDDQTIFAWKDSLDYPHPDRTRGLLASAPDVFLRGSPIVPIDDSDLIDSLHTARSPNPFHNLPRGYSILNDGIRITLPMKEAGDAWLAVLRCKGKDQKFPYGIYLTKRENCDGFLRTLPTKLQVLDSEDLKDLAPQTIRIVVDHHILPTIKRRQFLTLQSTDPVWKHCGYYVCRTPGSSHDVGQGGGYQALDPDTRIELSDNGWCACIYSQDQRGKVTVLLIRIRYHRPWVHLLTYDDLCLHVDTLPLRRRPVPPPMSSPTTQSSNRADSFVLSRPSTPRSIVSSPRSQSPSFTSTAPDTPQRRFSTPVATAGTNTPQRRFSTPVTQLHRLGGGTGCPVCSIIRKYSNMDDDIKNPRVDFVFKIVPMLDKEIEVDIRKGQVRRVTETMLEIDYVITVASDPWSEF